MGKKLIVILTIAALGIFTLAAVGCAAVTDQRAAVSGIVVADGLAQEGTQVKQGDILVKVKSIAGGSIAAARATTAGKVSQVLVKPGDKIEAQQVVARLVNNGKENRRAS